MPFGISQSQSDCSTWATVMKEADGSFTTIGCHASKDDAINQMVAASIDEGIDPLGQVDTSEARAETFTANKAMKEEAQRGLDWREEFGRGGTAIGAGRATDIVKGNPLSLDTVKRMVRYFQRHEADKDAEGFGVGEEGYPSNGRIAWALWGGDPGYRWAEEITDRLDVWDRDIDEEDDDEDEFDEPMPLEEEPEEEGEDIETRQNVVLSDEVMNMTELVQWIPTQQNESRSIAYSTLEFRAVGEGDTLVGYAAVFDSPSEPLPWIEYVRKGAFTKTINDGADVRLLIDHEGVPLARTKSGTLNLIEDDKGLRVEAQLDPSNPDAARVMSAMRRGDISQMSFAFRTIKDSWNAERTNRELKEVQLFDVSVVTFPAYEATVAELRKKEMDVTVPAPTSLLLRKNQLKLARHR